MMTPVTFGYPSSSFYRNKTKVLVSFCETLQQTLTVIQGHTRKEIGTSLYVDTIWPNFLAFQNMINSYVCNLLDFTLSAVLSTLTVKLPMSRHAVWFGHQGMRSDMVEKIRKVYSSAKASLFCATIIILR